jgi:hypothetical protein
VPRQNQLVPQIDQLIRANKPADIVLIALTEDLFVHAGALLTVGEVVLPRRAAPTDV